MEKNLDKIREAAIKGNAEAQYQFAVETWRYDEQYALKYFLQAAKNGNADAINSLKKGGVFIYFVRNHVEDAIVFFEELANKGDAEAMKCVGDCYSKAKIYNKAAEAYKKAVEMGRYQALMDLNRTYRYLEITEEDKKVFEALCNKVGSSNDARGVFYAAGMFMRARIVNKNVDKAVKLFKRSADMGDSWAKNQMGRLYFDGEFVEPNYEEAVRLFKETNNQMMLAECYLMGRGIEQDVDKAIKILEGLANEYPPCHSACERLAQIYDDGVYITPDYHKALYYLKDVAFTEEEGEPVNPDALYKIGCYYFDGKLGRKNKTQALKYFAWAYVAYDDMFYKETPDFFYDLCKILIENNKKKPIETLEKLVGQGDEKAAEVLSKIDFRLINKSKKVLTDEEKLNRRKKNREEREREKTESAARIKAYEEKQRVARMSKIEEEKPVEIAVGDKVVHKKFGEGEVYLSDGNYLGVKFEVGEKMMHNPKAFKDGVITKK